ILILKELVRRDSISLRRRLTRAKKKAVDSDVLVQEESAKKTSDDTKKQLLQRLWSEEDEIVILKESWSLTKDEASKSKAAKDVMKVLTLKSGPDLVFEGITIVSEILGTIARGFVLDKMTNTILNAFKSVGFHVKSGLENESNVSNPSSEPINMEGSQTQTSRQNCLKCLCSTIALLNISSSISGPKAAIALDGKERPNKVQELHEPSTEEGPMSIKSNAIVHAFGPERHGRVRGLAFVPEDAIGSTVAWPTHFISFDFE
ncbi:hypothetical protein HYC85_021746, partial [Camellia sinensis]